MALIQRRSDLLAVHPRRAELLEWCLRAASYRNTGILQDFNPRIEHRTFCSAKGGGRRNPLDARAFKKIVAVPVPHRNNVKVGPNVILRVEKLRQLSDRQSITHW